jgi:hypothetical protein
MSEENKLEIGTPQELLAEAPTAPTSFFVTAEEATKKAYTAFRAEVKKIMEDAMNRGVSLIELPVTAVDKAALETLKDELTGLGYKATISSKYSTKQKSELYQGQSGSETIFTIRF